MKKLVTLCTLALIALLFIASVAGCHQQPEEPPSLAIMVEANTVDAGSSFIVTGSNLNPQQKIWVEWKYRTSDGAAGCTGYCEPNEDGSIHPIIEVPENVVLGDYEVEIYIGKHFDDRELAAILPIHVKAMEE